MLNSENLLHNTYIIYGPPNPTIPDMNRYWDVAKASGRPDKISTVEPVYYGHLGTSQVSRLSRCPDFPGQFT